MEKPNGRCRVFTPWQHVRQFGFALVALCLVLQAGAANAAQILIDNFAEPDPALFFVLGTGNNPSKAMTQVTGGALGGQRNTLVNVVGQAQPNSVVGMIGHDTNFNLDALQVGTNGPSPSVTTLTYNGVDIVEAANKVTDPLVIGSGQGTDLTDGDTNNRFEIKFISSDAMPTAGLDVVITIASPGGGTSSVTGIAQNSQSAFSLLIPFSGLTGSGDLHHVETLTIAFNSLGHASNIDYEIKQIVAVPEPTTLTLAGLAAGVWALSVGMKRRGRQAWLPKAA